MGITIDGDEVLVKDKEGIKHMVELSSVEKLIFFVNKDKVRQNQEFLPPVVSGIPILNMYNKEVTRKMERKLL